MMHLQIRTEIDVETYLEPAMTARCDGRILAQNRAAHLVFSPKATLSSLFDICTGSSEVLQAHLVRCSGSRQPLIERVSLGGPDGVLDYRCFGSVLIPRRRSRPATLLLRFFPALDARFSARAERMRRALAERRWQHALDQSEQLRNDRLRLVEQYCFVAEALRVVEQRQRETQDEVRCARTDERERIAQDLHDLAGHEMAHVLVELRRMQEIVRGPARNRLQDIAVHVAEVGRKIHHAVIGNRPRIVEELGLGRALEVTLATFAADGGLNFGFRTRGTPFGPLPDNVENALYRVAQEALTNVVKHGLGAERVDLVLEFSATAVSLAISDDGAGFSTDAQQPGDAGDPGIGFRGMRQRMSNIGGSLQIVSRFGKGTTVKAIAPLLTGPMRNVAT